MISNKYECKVYLRGNLDGNKENRVADNFIVIF